ncbi:unnamed protein product [Blepharisma stoltei]|uniref:Uncharacterized protein n=1 Tax=Blepharisma stoltei TaxID=1481888 RepID=A0AAU9J4Z1_9CILI|nr:unnamed protein product [Blepharisma stoltei]
MKFHENKIKSIRCYIEECQEKPIKTCKCLGLKQFICAKHAGEHQNIEIHEMNGIFTVINEKSREILRRCAEELKSKVNLYWNEIKNNEVYGFTHNMYLMNLNVGIINKKCEEIISLCENLTEIPEYGDPTFMETILKMPIELIEDYVRHWKITTFKDYEGVIFSLGNWSKF